MQYLNESKHSKTYYENIVTKLNRAQHFYPLSRRIVYRLKIERCQWPAIAVSGVIEKFLSV